MLTLKPVNKLKNDNYKNSENNHFFGQMLFLNDLKLLKNIFSIMLIVLEIITV